MPALGGSPLSLSLSLSRFRSRSRPRSLSLYLSIYLSIYIYIYISLSLCLSRSLASCLWLWERARVPLFFLVHGANRYRAGMGPHKRGLKSQFFRENRAKILPGKSGIFGPDWLEAFPCQSRPFVADWDRFLRTSQPRGGTRNSSKGPFWAPIGAFWAKPTFAKPPFGFPQLKLGDWL